MTTASPRENGESETDGARPAGEPPSAPGAIPAFLPGRSSGKEERWTVLHVMSRQEKALVADLENRGLAVYLPLVRKTRYFGRRKATVEMPLFPGYVFFWGTLDQAYEADRTRRVANLIPVPDQGTLEQELRQIHRITAITDELDPCPLLTEGTCVEVISGPFKGLRGLVKERTRKNRLILQVSTVGLAVSLEIEGSLLEPLDR